MLISIIRSSQGYPQQQEESGKKMARLSSRQIHEEEEMEEDANDDNERAHAAGEGEEDEVGEEVAFQIEPKRTRSGRIIKNDSKLVILLGV